MRVSSKSREIFYKIYSQIVFQNGHNSQSGNTFGKTTVLRAERRQLLDDIEHGADCLRHFLLVGVLEGGGLVD